MTIAIIIISIIIIISSSSSSSSSTIVIYLYISTYCLSYTIHVICIVCMNFLASRSRRLSKSSEYRRWMVMLPTLLFLSVCCSSFFDAGILEAPHEPSDRRMGKPRHPCHAQPGSIMLPALLTHEIGAPDPHWSSREPVWKQM